MKSKSIIKSNIFKQNVFKGKILKMLMKLTVFILMVCIFQQQPFSALTFCNYSSI